MNRRVIVIGNVLIIVGCIVMAGISTFHFFFDFGIPDNIAILGVVSGAVIVFVLAIGIERILLNPKALLLESLLILVFGVVSVTWTIAGYLLGFGGVVLLIGVITGTGLMNSPLSFDPRFNWSFQDVKGGMSSGRAQALTKFENNRLLYILFWDSDKNIVTQAFREGRKKLLEANQTDGEIIDSSVWSHKAKMLRGISSDGWHLIQYLYKCDKIDLYIYAMVTGNPESQEIISKVIEFVKCHTPEAE